MHTRLVRILFALAFVLAAGHAAAQSPNERFEQFLGSVSGNSDAAIDKLFAGSRVQQISPQGITALKTKVKSTIGNYGKYVGFEKASERDITPSLRRMVYVQKFELYPVVWVVYQYKTASNDWILNSLNFTSEVGNVFNAVP